MRGVNVFGFSTQAQRESASVRNLVFNLARRGIFLVPEA